MALQKIGQPAQETVGALSVVKLVNSKEGNYKELSDGTIVPLTEKEWGVEMVKAIRKPPPPKKLTGEEFHENAVIKPRLQKVGEENKGLRRIG